ncbi:P-loop containing nucleoside triphosphate hydrolase protein, partial [Ochromonadaceae sp. CCMP2298]
MLEALHLLVQMPGDGNKGGGDGSKGGDGNRGGGGGGGSGGGAAVLTLSTRLRDLLLYSYPNSLLRLSRQPGGLRLALPALPTPAPAPTSAPASVSAPVSAYGSGTGSAFAPVSASVPVAQNSTSTSSSSSTGTTASVPGTWAWADDVEADVEAEADIDKEVEVEVEMEVELEIEVDADVGVDVAALRRQLSQSLQPGTQKSLRMASRAMGGLGQGGTAPATASAVTTATTTTTTAAVTSASASASASAPVTTVAQALQQLRDSKTGRGGVGSGSGTGSAPASPGGVAPLEGVEGTGDTGGIEGSVQERVLTYARRDGGGGVGEGGSGGGGEQTEGWGGAGVTVRTSTATTTSRLKSQTQSPSQSPSQSQSQSPSQSQSQSQSQSLRPVFETNLRLRAMAGMPPVSMGKGAVGVGGIEAEAVESGMQGDGGGGVGVGEEEEAGLTAAEIDLIRRLTAPLSDADTEAGTDFQSAPPFPSTTTTTPTSTSSSFASAAAVAARNRFFEPREVESALGELGNLLDSAHQARLNPSQLSAITSAVQRPLTLIQGPPGTGKTKTACALLATLVLLKQARMGDVLGGARSQGLKGDRILACAHSNVAADNLLQGLAELGWDGKGTGSGPAGALQVTRLGRPANVRGALWECTLDAQLMRNSQWALFRSRLDQAVDNYNEVRGGGGAALGDAQRALGSAKRVFAMVESNAIQQVLSSSDVVVSTCIGAGADLLRAFAVEQGVHFRTVLVDEAAQCTEAAVLPALAYGCERLVLIGDQNQLPPVVVSPTSLSNGLGVSMFVRLIAAGLDVSLLEEQYRMHPKIAQFSSQAFYGGRVRSRVQEGERPLPRGFQWPNPRTPIAFIDISPWAGGPAQGQGMGLGGQEGTGANGEGSSSSSFFGGVAVGQGYESTCNSTQTSYSNQREAEAVRGVVEGLAQAGCSLGDIGVISPYNAQVRLLGDMFRAKGWVDGAGG